jgi:hypothetical protein
LRERERTRFLFPGILVHPLTIRFAVAGLVIIVGGVAIAATGAGVGEGAVWKGALVAAAGAGLIVSGIVRFRKPPSE